MQVHWPLVVVGEISQQLIALYYSAGSAQCYYSKIKGKIKGELKAKK